MQNTITNTPEGIYEYLQSKGLMPPYATGFDKRNIILETSLVLEKASSIFISELLGITDWKNSLTLGNKGSSLSFNQKIDLLIDLGALTDTEKNKFKAFMEIRNKFMHVFDANSFAACFEIIKETGVFLKKAYPDIVRPDNEETLEARCIKLSDDVFSLTLGIINSVIKKNRETLIKDTFKNAVMEMHQPTIIKLKEIENKIKQGLKISYDELTVLKAEAAFLLNWQKEFVEKINTIK